MKADDNFFEKVYEVVRLIPSGRVTNYGAIAKCIGSPGASRMVGWALNNCHTLNDFIPHQCTRLQQAMNEYIGMLGVIDAEDIPMGRITRLDEVVTMLHTNDTHGRWEADSYGGGFAYLADLIAKERAHNPNALLLDAGDTFQGNSFAYFFKDRPDNPIAGGMNLLGFDAMTVGNHEFNFGPATFANMLGQVNFPLLGTINMDDDGSYGFINDNVQDYINVDINGTKVTIFGITNPRVYRYELPTNIPGLTFYSGLDTGFAAVPQILADENPDLLVGLTHMGYSPYGGEIDSDLLLAEGVAGIDVIIGGHSHTTLDPAVMVTSDINPEGTLIAQARRYAGYLGQVNVGFIGGEVVLREGFLIPTSEATPNAALEAYLAPYLAEIDAYNATVIGQTEVPIDALEAYTQETNGANLQADAAVWELADKEGVTVDMHLSGAMSNRLVAAGADMLTLYQETYHRATYERLHKKGPKADYGFRIDAPEHGCKAGMRSVTVGALFGLHQWQNDAFFAALHADYLQKKYPSVEIGISFPRLRPQAGDFTSTHFINDRQFVKMLTALRIFLPSVSMTLSTRESQEFRNAVLPLGVTRMSAGVSTSVGGHSGHQSTPQFEIADNRDVPTICRDLLDAGFQPVMHDWNFALTSKDR